METVLYAAGSLIYIPIDSLQVCKLIREELPIRGCIFQAGYQGSLNL
uniref:Uncharacterized protein n=1 Tax=Anguilla anguilla TaxID=7936 RepID=A0A0E9V503_ANGAN